MGTYGYQRNTTPNLDVFAQESIVFENAFSVASWTLPVAMSIYTSQYPLSHGVMTRHNTTTNLSRNTLPLSIPTLIEALKENGYTTATINGNNDYRGFGLTDRMDYTSSLVRNASEAWGMYGSIKDVAPQAMDWLNENRDKKFFLHVQAYDPHCPFALPQENTLFDPVYEGNLTFSECYWTFEKTEPIFIQSPAGEEERYLVKTTNNRELTTATLTKRDIEHMVALYDGEIYESDRWIGKILDYLKEEGLMNKTIIVFFSEHGDMFGKHGRFMRGGPLRGTFYDDVLQVPLMIYHPQLKAMRTNNFVSLIDLAPGLLNFLEITPPDEFQGISFLPLLVGNKTRERIFAGSLYAPESENTLFNVTTIVFAIRDREWKLITETVLYYDQNSTTTYELYNIQEDPEELINQENMNVEKLHELNTTLNRWKWCDLGILSMDLNALKQRAQEEYAT